MKTKSHFLLATIIMVVANTSLFSQKVDSLVVLKADRKLLLYKGGNIMSKYKISLGANPKGAKEKEGDEKTPEGQYLIFDKAPPSSTQYHKNLGINYPNASDIAKGRTGGEIKIHGLGSKYAKWGKLHRLRDWTDGCIAVTNKEMDFIYDHVSKNTPIIIYP